MENTTKIKLVIDREEKLIQTIRTLLVTGAIQGTNQTLLASIINALEVNIDLLELYLDIQKVN